MIERVSHRNVCDSSSVATFHTIVGLFVYGCSQEPERPAILVEGGLTITRRELLARTARFAGFLAGRVRSGDRVVVMLGDRIEFIVALLGIVANRATLVSIPHTAQETDVGQILHENAPTLAIAGTQQAALLKKHRTNVPSMRDILIVEGPEPEGLTEFGHSISSDVLHDSACRRDDLVTLNYSPRVTGVKRGRMLDHGWWLRVLDVDQRLYQRSSQDRQLCCLPICSVLSVLQLLTSLSTRGSLIAMRAMSASRFWDVVRNLDATEVLSYGSMPATLLQGKPGTQERDHRMRIAFHAGVPKDLHCELAERFGFDWLDNYGNTECGLMSRVPMHMARELIGSGSIGLEVPDVEIRIVDEAGNDVADGIVGAALVRGPNLFRGYVGHPDLTSEGMRGGWYCTGDLLRRDERGLLYFIGSNEDVNRHSGESIAPSQTGDSRFTGPV